MSYSTPRVLSLAAMAAIGSLTLLAACYGGPDDGDTDSEELIGAPEDVAAGEDAITGSVKVGSTLIATNNVNLRTGPSTSKTILHVVPQGSAVKVVEADPENGFYRVKHNGTTGWSSGKYYKVGSSDQGAPSGARAKAIARAKDGVGFSYWWGHGRFKSTGPTSATKGSCSGSCPSCSHKGSYGGDCSGYAAKVWQVPSTNDDLSDDSHPYSTWDFAGSSSKWSKVSRDSVKAADAFVYNTGSAGHIFIYSSGDGWGSMYAYECKGCSYGCVYNLRTATSAYKAIRRAGW